MGKSADEIEEEVVTEAAQTPSTPPPDKPVAAPEGQQSPPEKETKS